MQTIPTVISSVSGTVTIDMSGTIVKLSGTDGRFSVEVLTPEGQPSELTAGDLLGSEAAEYLIELPALIAECPSAAATPLVNFELMQTLLRAGVRNPRAVASVARPIKR